MLSSCKKTDDNVSYFKNYNSTPLYSSANKLLSLPENYEFYSYDSVSGLFMIQRNVLAEYGGVDVRYGLCTEEKILIEPMFSSIIDIRNNHAIVTTKEYFNNELKEKIGVINIKTNSFGFEVSDSFAVEYNSQINQYTFLDDSKLVIIGGKNPILNYDKQPDYSFSVVYDYSSSNTLLEIGKIPHTSATANFKYNDGYISVSMHGSVSMPGQVRFYDFNDIQNGEFREIKKYVPFEILEYGSTEVVPYYLGNYEYVLVGIRADSQEFDGYEMIRTGINNKPEYVKIMSTGYNVKLNREFDVGKVLIVANNYSADFISAITTVYAGAVELGYTKDYKLYKDDYTQEEFYKYIAEKIYDYPMIETQKLVKKGHSIFYEAYLTGVLEGGQKIYLTSFVIYTPQGTTELVENAYLPLLFVDGYGVERIDPNFSLAPEDAKFYTYNDGDVVSVIKSEDKIAYSQYIVHDKVLIAEKNDLRSEVNQDYMQKFGAIDVETQKVILDFEYDFITPFFSNYSIAGKYKYKKYIDENSGEEFECIDSVDYWQVEKNKDGKAKLTPISNVYSVHNGSYVKRDAKKFKLYANDGKELLSEEYDELTVLDLSLTGEKMFGCYVFGKKGNVSTLYKLK